MIEFSITIGRVVVVSILYLSVGTIECVIFYIFCIYDFRSYLMRGKYISGNFMCCVEL